MFNCENCKAIFNGRKQYDAKGEVFCPSCGFLVFREPSVNVYKKDRQRRDLPPLPQINKREWAKKQREGAYEKKWKKEEKEKD